MTHYLYHRSTGFCADAGRSPRGARQDQMTKRNRDNLVSGLIVVGVIAGSLTLHAF